MKPNLLVKASLSVFMAGIYSGSALASDVPVAATETSVTGPGARLAKASKKKKKNRKEAPRSESKSKRKVQKKVVEEDLEQAREEEDSDRVEEESPPPKPIPSAAPVESSLFQEEKTASEIIPSSSVQAATERTVSVSASEPQKTDTVSDGANPDWGARKGDFAIGFDAVPMLNFALNAVNIFGDTGQQAGGLINWPQGYENTIQLKYMMTDNIAIRTLFGASSVETTTSNFGPHPLDVADPEILEGEEQEIEDKLQSSTGAFWLGGGFEVRDTFFERLQGYAGLNAMFRLSGTSSRSQYGWDYDSDAAELGVIQEGSERQTSTDSGLTAMFSGRAFVGVEYFILPKVSLGAEYGLSMSFVSQGRGKKTVEAWNAEDEKAELLDEEGGTSSSSSLISSDIGNAMGADGQGSMFVTVYF